MADNANSSLENSSYSLVATINHPGSLSNRHYWAIIKHGSTKQWFSCNDKVGLQIKAHDLNNKASYVLFFVRKWLSFFFPVVFLQGGFVDSDIIFGCDNLTHNPSSVRVLSFLTQF